MYVSFTSSGMHGICMWFIAYDLSLAWRMDGIDSGLPSLAIYKISMVIVGLFSLLFFWLALMFP